MQGKRERFTDRLDDFEAVLQVAMTQMEKANRDLVYVQAFMLKHLNTMLEEWLKRSKNQLDAIESGCTMKQFDIMDLKAQAEEIERYLTMPWWKRLFTRKPIINAHPQ